MEKISAIIITGNSESTIEKCLESVKTVSNEIIIIDSFSTDRTLEYAKKYTGKVFSQKWLGYSKQKQAAVEKTVNNWVLWIDSDEVVSGELADEIRGLDFSRDGYYLNRKTFYLNRWINHCGWHPDYVLRLFKKDKGTFNNDPIHEKVVITGNTARLEGLVYHYSYRDITHHIEKMNAFTSLAAQKMFERRRKVTPVSIMLHSVGHFIKVYFFKKGSLDGIAGLIICVLSGYYVFLKYAKLWELHKQSSK